MKTKLNTIALIIIGFFTFNSSIFAKDIYTCKVNGGAVYQGKPCAGSKELSDQVAQSKQKIADQDSRAAKERDEWNSKKEPQIGMTSAQVGASKWGHPQKYSETQTANGLSEFWHYGSGRVIYFRNGTVVSITK